MEKKLVSYRGAVSVLRKDGKYTTRRWRGVFTNIGKWIREREKFLRDICHFTQFDINIDPQGKIVIVAGRPEGKYNGRTLRRMSCIYVFTPIQ